MPEQPSYSEKIPITDTGNDYPASFDNLTPSVQEKMKMRWDKANGLEKADIEKLMKPEQPEVKEIDLENMVVRLIYEVHYQKHSPLVVQGLDNYASEGDITFESIKKIKSDPYSLARYFDTSSEDLAQATLKDQGKPVLFIDIISSPELSKIMNDEMQASTNIRTGTEIIFTGTALASLYYLLESFLSKIEENKKLSRRRFLQTLGASSIAATGLVGQTFHKEALPEGSVMRTLERGTEQIKESLGFGEIIYVYRNAVMAQKLHNMAMNYKNEGAQASRKPHFGLRIGTAHSGIESMLKMPEAERLAFITKITHTLKKRGIEVNPAGMVRLQYDQAGKAFLSYETDEKIQQAIGAEK